MAYCKKCGGLLIADKTGARCSKCSEQNNTFEFKEQFKAKKKPAEVTEHVEVKETANVTCPFCGNKTAYVAVLGALYTDEEDTHVMKCCKCGKSWREGYQW